MYYLAIDIGASSGRHILASVENGRIETKEIYRFSNGVSKKNGHLCWDLEALFNEIINGMKVAGEMGTVPESVGIDCFGVDFVLLDERGWVIGDTVSYRDSRTQGIRDSVRHIVSEERIYERTGQRAGDINSVYQLLAIKEQNGDDLSYAWRFLHLPDYFNYLLTGLDANELTDSETSMLVNKETLDFDKEMIEALGLPAGIFRKPLPPMTVLGSLKPAVQAKVGYNCKVVLTASHDTISAMLAAPVTDNSVIISSGTWSMLACYATEAIKSMDAGFSNPHLKDGTLLHMKGVTGLWIVQSIKKELGGDYTYDSLCDAAMASDYKGRIDVEDAAFSAPDSMIQAIKDYLAAKGEKAPESIGDIMECVYHSLAAKYADVIREMEKHSDKSLDKINVVGGGSKDPYLNKLTEEYTGKKVYAGPAESTAIGNLLAQFVGMGAFASVEEAKEALKVSLNM